MIASSTARHLALIPWVGFVVFEATAQIALKQAASSGFADASGFSALATLLISPWFYLSIAADCCAFLTWMSILSSYALSFAVPLSASSYIAILAASLLFLHEPIGGLQAFGIALIGAGIILMAHEDPESGEEAHRR